MDYKQDMALKVLSVDADLLTIFMIVYQCRLFTEEARPVDP